jgi:hypothetical protein
MSLLRPIIRACAVGALRDKTWAEKRVYDSNMTPFADAVLGQAKAQPYICVYTDSDDISPVTGFAELYNGANRQLSVVLEIGIASAIQGANGATVIKFSATDEGMEWACDIIETQVIAALIGDPHSGFGDLFKRMIGRVLKMPSRRGGQAATGVRFAARRVTLVCSTIYDIAPGVVLAEHHPVNEFIRMANANPSIGLTDVAGIISSVLATTAAPSWRQAQAYLGLPDDAIRRVNPDGTPLPVPMIEKPPLDWSETNEYVPVLTNIEIDR